MPPRLMKPLAARKSGEMPDVDRENPRSRPARVSERLHMGAVATPPDRRVRLPASCAPSV